MSSSSGSTVEQSSHQSWGHCGGGHGRRGNWSGVNTAAMVLGFVFFWPIGLMIMFWIMSGRNVRALPGAIRQQWLGFSDRWEGMSCDSVRSGNVVFNDYQNTQYDRIREIKEEIKVRSHRFSTFRSDAKRRADEEEFNRFMSSAPEGNNS
ncbi:MAG: DUF2852 domain-containing protein [Granulosicoccus sp.]